MPLDGILHKIKNIAVNPYVGRGAVAVAVFAAISCINYFIVIDDNRAALEEVKLVSVVPLEETIAINMEGVRVLGSVGSRGGKYPEALRFWTGLETKEWLLLNRDSALNTCRTVMDPFLRRTPSNRSSMSATSMDLVASAISGRTVNTAVYVPRFTGIPKGLGYCPGFRYDVAAGLLMVGERKVAVLSKEGRDLR